MAIIEIEKKVEKWLQKLEKSNPYDALKIDVFIKNTLKNGSEPTALPNAKKLQGYKDNILSLY